MPTVRTPDPSEQSESSPWDSASSGLESVRTTLRALDEVGKELQRHLRLPEMTEIGKSALGVWAKEFQEVFRPFRAAFQQSMTALRAEYAEFVKGESIQNLMQHGWFPDFGLSFREVMELADAFSADPEQANEVLLDRFRDRLDDIEVDVTSAFPNRSAILRDAFQAHRQGQYNLSVTVFLTQADGFFYDRFLKSLFYGDDRHDIAEHIEQMPDGLLRSMSRALLYDDWPLITPRKQRQQQPGGFTELNRHQVLHGEVTDYGTEENSLKAISLLNYCAFVLPEPESADDEENE